MFRNPLFTIQIDIPAVDALAAVLKSGMQAQIDQRTATVTSITEKLKTANAALKAATQQTKEK